MTTKTRKAPTARPRRKMSTAEAKKKADEMVAMDVYLEGRFDRLKPTGPRDPNFDRAAALEKLSAWSIYAVNLLDQLYDTFEDLSNALDKSPDLCDLIHAPTVHKICYELSDLSANSSGCIPKPLQIPRPV